MKKINEGINKIDNYFIAYHRTKYENLEHIIDEGFKPGQGSMYGKGWYFTYDLSSQTRSGMTFYGNSIIKAKINPKNLLVFDYNIAKDIFGNKYTLVDQFIEHYKIYRSLSEIPRRLFEISKDLEQTIGNPSYSASVAYNNFVENYVVHGVCSLKKVRGIIFSGNHDGNVLISYSYDTAIPFEYALTNKDDGQLITEWLSVKNINKAISRADLAEKAINKFHGEVKRIEVDNYDISNLEKDFPWLFKCKMQDAIFKIHDNKTFEWINGTWLRGHWQGDIWDSGIFKSGVWHKGEFLSGDWMFGNFLAGMFAGTWHDGLWKGGTFSNTATWLKGEIQLPDQRRPIKTTSSPIYFKECSFEFLDLLSNIKFENLDESFYYSDLSQQEKDDLYHNFETSYKKAVGSAWDKDLFESRAYGWVFFGSYEGGLALRKQKSGMYKLNATFGSPRKVVDAFKEMQSDLNGQPIWGVMTYDLAKMLEKLSKNDFKMPPKLFTKTLIPYIKHIFSSEIKSIEKDGAIVVSTVAGDMKKYFIANKQYYRDLLDNAEKYPDKIPVPPSVLKVLIKLIKLII